MDLLESIVLLQFILGYILCLIGLCILYKSLDTSKKVKRSELHEIIHLMDETTKQDQPVIVYDVCIVLFFQKKIDYIRSKNQVAFSAAFCKLKS